MAPTQPASQSALALRISLITAIAGLALVFLAALILDPPISLSPEDAPDPATPTASQLAAALEIACAEAVQELEQGDRTTANALLAAAGVTAENYLERLRGECLSTWILTAPAPPVSPSPWVTAGKAWDAFVKATFTPLASAVGFVVAGWLSIFVLARLLVEAPPIRNLTSDRASRNTAGWLGWGLLILVPIAAVIAGMYAKNGLGAWVWVILVALGVIAVIAVSMWLATLQVLRVEVTADGAAEAGKAISAALITARLRELTSASGSIEVPAGPLVKELTTDLKDFSSVGWVAGIQKLALFLIGVTPWTATAVIRSDSAGTVTVVRNRKTIRTETVAAAGPQLAPLAKPPDGRATTADYLSVLIAAEILFALREGYRDEFAEGLTGATVARSVGLQYIAIEWFTDKLDTSDATSLLAAATRADPLNELARYSFAYVQYRHATTAADLIAFGNTLDRWIGTRRSGRGFEDELLRAMTMARTAAARNLAATAMAAKVACRPSLTPAAKAAAVHALDTARGHLDHLVDTAHDITETERTDLARIRFAGATLTRARMVLNKPGPASSFIGDLNGSLEAAKNGASQIEKSSITAVQDALEADLFTNDPLLAYSLATELVCWERQRLIDCMPVTRVMRVAEHVTVFDEFAGDDPELATAVDYRAWKKDRARKARLAKTTPAKG